MSNCMFEVRFIKFVLKYYNKFSKTQKKSNNLETMTTIHQPTLFHIVDSIKLKRFKVSRSRTPQTDSDSTQSQKFKKNWSRQEQRLFFNIIAKYGADYSILKHHFPSKTRRQIKRKCTQVEESRMRDLDSLERRRSEEKRKDFFDREVMEIDMIKWHNSKPNKPEGNVTQAHPGQ